MHMHVAEDALATIKRPSAGPGPAAADLLGDLKAKMKGGGKWMDWVWIGGATIVVLTVMLGSFTSIQPGEVAVRVNNLTGAQLTVTQPGLVTRLP
ncbi:MAG TPA: hypothetical protein VGB85_30875, partial [Nannocystis sp.]